MPIQIAQQSDPFAITRETRAEAWSSYLNGCQTHDDVMALYADAWAAWNSAARRGALTKAHRDAVVLADAARAASIETRRKSGVAGDAQSVAGEHT